MSNGKGSKVWRWVGQMLVRIALRHLDTDGDGSVTPEEVMAWVWANIIGPALVRESRVSLTASEFQASV